MDTMIAYDKFVSSYENSNKIIIICVSYRIVISIKFEEKKIRLKL